MCISTGNFDSIFFLWITLFLNFEIWRKWKILLKQLVSATPLKPLNRIAWNFVIMKDIMCRYAFLQEMLIWSFWGAIYIPFFLRLPVNNAWNCHSYSILKQCWSVGYVSLLTLSFIWSWYINRLLKYGPLVFRKPQLKNCQKEKCWYMYLFSKMIQINISLIDTCMNIILHLKLELFVQSK